LSKLALLWVEREPKPKMGMEVVWVILDSQSEHVLEVRRLSFEVEGKSEKLVCFRSHDKWFEITFLDR
jgi:hypothetical protein